MEIELHPTAELDMYIYIYVYICICICIHIYIYICVCVRRLSSVGLTKTTAMQGTMRHSTLIELI